jgi:DNA mismatch repair protein MutS2
MDSIHLNTLEYPKILAQLARHTSFSAGRQRALTLQPSPVVAEVRLRLQETREARHLLDSDAVISLGGVRDIRPLAQNARRGAILQPADLLNIQDTLRAGSRIQRALARKQAEVPLLADIASRIEPCDELAGEIERCISDQGDVVDDASAGLARIRRQMRTAYERLMEKLSRIVADPNNASFLQEALVTQRAGRYVIPIKADFKGRIPGIVHDSSASGATLFIEPLSAVELGNRWRQSRIEEEKEVERILAELSSLVAAQEDSLAWTVEALAELDVAMAKARYATALDASEPAISPFDAEGLERHPGTTLVLRQARHPLLDPETVVPIDIHLSDEYFILVITGPNTGGKTVSLKTVGLMAAMAQSGLHLPVAEHSALSVFDAIYADIGDEQSIEQSLSTFSSHLTNIVRILKSATCRSLLLFDELGAGTDPVEGSALARAILSHLLARRFTALVATHYSELKTFAHTTLGVENASVEFSLETLSPTYKLSVGLPGRSNAFAIAQRLGLSSGIVDEARALVSPEELAAESLLAEIQQAHQEATRARDEALSAQRLLGEKQHRVASRLAAIEGERAAILGEARAEARRELAEMRREIEGMQAEIEGRQSQGTLGGKWLAEARARLAEKEDAVAPVHPRVLTHDTNMPGVLSVGDSVWVEGLGTTGEVTALDGDSADVQVGSFHVRVQQSSLERRAGPQPSTQDNDLHSAGFHPSPGIELDLRGQRVEEVLPRVDKYLDDAFLAGLDFVRLIHGKGTGVLRQAVRQQLRDHALVESHRPGEQGEGGSGVTIAYLIKG